MERTLKRSNGLPERVTDLYLVLMLTAFLLWPGSGGYAQITYYKATAYVCLSGGYLAVMLLFISGGKAGSVSFKRLSVAQRLILGYWLATAFSTMAAVDHGRAFFGGPRAEGFLTISLYCGSFLLVSLFAKPRGWMLGLFAAAMSANCVLALFQLGGYNPLALYPAGMNYYDGFVRYGGQFLGTVGNVDLLSALLCVAIPVFWIALLRLEDRRRFLLLIPLGLSVSVLVLVWIEGGIVGVSGSLLLGLPVVLKKPNQRRMAFVGAVVVLIAALTAVYVLGGRLSGFLFEAHELLYGRFDERFGSGRLYIWQECWKLVPERPLLGGGPETLGLRTQAAFERFDEALGVTLRSTVDTAHNEYLNILVNQGLLALVCYLGALMSAAAGWIRSAREHPAAAICGGGVLGYCIQAFFGISAPMTTPFFWLTLALLTTELQKNQKEG